MKWFGSVAAVALALALAGLPGTVAAVEVGEKAPDFELVSTKGGNFKLSDLAGKKHLVVQFYILDFSPTWIKELSSSRDDYSKFQAVDAEVVGISGNSRFSQQAFADFIKLNYPLLSDSPELKVAQAYGVFNAERKLPVRSWFIIDKQGVVRYKKVLAPKEPLIENDALIAELKKLK